MKLLLYCTKAKPYLYANISALEEPLKLSDKDVFFTTHNTNSFKRNQLNGKIVAECDFEVEEHKETTVDWLCMSLREKIIFGNMCEKATIDELKCYKYANGKPLYAIHIKNLHIFDKPKELSCCFTKKSYNDINKIFTDEIMIDREWYRPVNKAPQNMMRVKRVLQEDGILISIQPQWLCKILNGEKTIEVRKKVLKEMIK